MKSIIPLQPPIFNCQCSKTCAEESNLAYPNALPCSIYCNPRVHSFIYKACGFEPHAQVCYRHSKRRTQDLNLQAFYSQRFSRPLPRHPDIRQIWQHSGTAISEIAFATTLYNFMRTFYRLRQTFFQVYCRKLAQCVGFEPTRRINARRLSKPFQYHYGNTAEFSCIVKNIRKETADTFLAGVMPAGGFEPPFCYHAYSGI